MTTITMRGHTFRVDQQYVDVTSMTKPDTSWVYVDLNGHEHRWVDGKLPTLVVVSDGEYWCDDCRDEHSSSHYECLLCSSRVEPRSASNDERQYVAGLRSLYVDGESVGRDVFKAKWVEYGGDPAAVEGLCDEQKAQRAAYRERARKFIDDVGEIMETTDTLVKYITVSNHANVQSTEDGAFVECVLWVPKESL